MKLVDAATISEVRMQIEKIQCKHAVPNTSLRSYLDFSIEAIVIEMQRKIAMHRGEQVLKVPATWWDAFKIRFFRPWMLARWPAKYTRHRAVAFYPNIAIPYHDSEMVWHEWRRDDE